MNSFPYNYLSTHGELLARFVADSAASRLQALDPADIVVAYESLVNLYQHEPANYFLPAIGPLYSMMFHGRRMHDAICNIYTALRYWQPSEPFAVIDYGTGTGSVVWALTWLYASGCLDKPRYPTQIDAIDTSVHMLNEARALWQDLILSTPRVADMVSVRWVLGTTNDTQIDDSSSTRLVFASYPFSSASTIRHESELLFSYAARREWSHLALWSSPTKMRKSILNHVAETTLGVLGVDTQLLDDVEAGFWNDKWIVNKCKKRMEQVVGKWRNTDVRARMLGRIIYGDDLFTWRCTRPDYPMMCWTRSAPH